ncbi:unnamed protein product, partial [Ectocarpus sp. 13 AM-2016]
MAAGECESETPTTTCGCQQTHLISPTSISSMSSTVRRRDSYGDNVSYVLVRTVRSNRQYLAALEIGARGTGHQCQREGCFSRARSMFCGKGMQGIP